MEGESLTKKEKRKLARQLKEEERKRRELFLKIKKFLIAAIPLLLLIWIGSKQFGFFTKTSSPQVLSQEVEVLDNDWIRGKRDAKVTLIEYGDFQCPACTNYEPILKELLQKFPSDLKLVYRHFPLSSIHRNAYDASRASEAAGKQGKFWEMHDLLYQRQKDWEGSSNPKDVFLGYARELGLDEEKFKSDFDSKEIEEKINKDTVSGGRLRLNATPTFFLNGQKVQPRSYEEFSKLVEDQIRGYTFE